MPGSHIEQEMLKYLIKCRTVVVVKHDLNQLKLLNKRNPSNVHIDNIYIKEKKKKSQVTKAKALKIIKNKTWIAKYHPIDI